MVADHKTERGLTWILPFLSSLALVLITQLQYKIAFLENAFPFLPLIAVYYWCVFKPRLMPVPAAFALGLFQDIISGGPLGLMALLLVLVRIVVVQQSRRFLEREFLFNWVIFIIVSCVFGLLIWAISSIYLKETQNIWVTFGQSAVTIAIFPVVFWALGKIGSRLVTDNR